MTTSIKTIETVAQTSHAVAYQLTLDILKCEGKTLYASVGSPASATREDILSTYSECLDVVVGNKKPYQSVKKAA